MTNFKTIEAVFMNHEGNSFIGWRYLSERGCSA